jgi:exosortase
MNRRDSRGALFEVAVVIAIAVQYRTAVLWIARTWREATYESWGFLPLLLLVPRLFRLPGRRSEPSWPHLLGIAGLALGDLLSAPLQLNVLSALLGLLSLHLFTVAFRSYSGRWYLETQLWLAVLCLPAVYFGNAFFGYPLQHLVTRLAAGGLALYGIPVAARGTVLHLPDAVITVDATCSGLKLLYTGILFGLLVPTRACSTGRRVGFWVILVGLLFGANVVRVISLAVAHLYLGHPASETVHQGMGLVAFVMVCGLSLALLRRLSRTQPCSEACP